MRLLKWVLGIVIGWLVLMAGIGFVLPAKFTVSRSIVINTAPDRVYAWLDDPRRWKEWTAWNRRDPSTTNTYVGVERGVGATWSWNSHTEGAGRMRFVSAESGRRLSYEWQSSAFNAPWQGELRLANAGLGTRLTWIVNGDSGNNPLLRWMSVFADSLIGKNFETGLANLKALAEKPGA